MTSGVYNNGKRKSNGYIFIKYPGHLRADVSGYVPKHTLAMEMKIGRFLTQHEVVHHINMDKLDCRSINLHLFKNPKTHMKAHGSIHKLIKPLIERGIIQLDKEKEVYFIEKKE